MPMNIVCRIMTQSPSESEWRSRNATFRLLCQEGPATATLVVSSSRSVDARRESLPESNRRIVLVYICPKKLLSKLTQTLSLGDRRLEVVLMHGKCSGPLLPARK